MEGFLIVPLLLLNLRNSSLVILSKEKEFWCEMYALENVKVVTAFKCFFLQLLVIFPI